VIEEEEESLSLFTNYIIYTLIEHTLKSTNERERVRRSGRRRGEKKEKLILC
jgi:hypothetical protein